MQYLRVFVKFASDAVPAVFAHDGKIMFLGVSLNRVTDVPEAHAGFDHADSLQHAFVRDLHQTLRLDRGFADKKHFAGISVVAIFDNGDVDVDDISLFGFLSPGMP